MLIIDFLVQVHIKSHFIMNGVCVKFRGWLDLERLDGVGCLEFDERRAAHEDSILRAQIEQYNQRLRDFEDKQRAYRGDRQDELDAVRRGGIGVGVGGSMWRR